jgi:hypothetical protein
MEYDAEHGPPGLKQFTSHLRQVIWPRNFKLEKLRKYDGKENPDSWVMLYEITIRSATGDEHVMANYLPVVLDQAGHQWLLSLLENQFDRWSALRQAFIDNFIATCDQPGNKYDLECIHDRAGKPLRDYIRRFSDMHLKIPRITHDEAVSAFIKGLRYHDALRSKLLRKRPSTVSELLATAKNYADADDAEKIIKEDVGGPSYPEHPPRRDENPDDRGRNNNRDRRDRCNNNRDRRDNRERWPDNHGDYRGKRPREDDHEVNVVKKPAGRCDYQEDYNKAMKSPCQIHPKSNHTMENCRFLKNIYTKQIAKDDAPKAIDDGPRCDGDDDDDDEQDRNPRHQYINPTKTVHSIFGGKVSLESKHERKLQKRTCLNIVNADDLISDPRLPAWSHHEIFFSRADRWAVIPEPGQFPFVLDPCINSVRFERVLVDGGSSIDILFRSSSPALKLTQADLKPYDAQF